MNSTEPFLPVYKDWPHKRLTCLLPGAACLVASNISLLGIISNPRLGWKCKVFLTFPMHPIYILEGFVICYFSMVDIQEVIHRPTCTKLVKMGVLAQWGVTVSTLAISLGRVVQLLSTPRVRAWMSFLSFCWDSEGMSLLASVLSVLAMYCAALALTYASTPRGFGLPHGPGCVRFLTTQDTFPHRIVGFCIIGVVVLILASTVIIITSKRRGRQLPPAVVIRIQRDQRLARLPDDVVNLPQGQDRPAMANLDPGQRQPEHAQVVINRGRLAVNTQLRVTAGRGIEGLDEESQDNENNQAPSGANPSREDFYDYELTRHPAQSSPPVDQIAPIGQNPLVDQILAANERQATPPNNVIGQNINRVGVPESYLDFIFSPRNTRKNKQRFPYTKLRRRRNVSSMTDFTHASFSRNAPHFYYTDHLICISTLLYTLTYTPFACYLLYIADNSAHPFLDQSFEPIIGSLAAKGSIHSIVYLGATLL